MVLTFIFSDRIKILRPVTSLDEKSIRCLLNDFNCGTVKVSTSEKIFYLTNPKHNENRG